MAVTIKMYSNAPSKLANGEIDWDTDTIKISLHTSSHTPDQDNDEYFDDVDNEVVGAGYVAGGGTLAGASNSVASKTTTLDGNDYTWPNSTITAYYAIIYKDTGVAGTSPLICYIDFGENKITNNTDFKITFNASGILSSTVS